MSGRLLKTALEYAAHGWAIFPCKTQGKQPLTKNGCNDATTDVKKITSWWARWPQANIGIATGIKSGIVVIDIDNNEEKGVFGSDSLRMWESEFSPLPKTWSVITGGGGTHYFFSTDRDIKNRTGALEGIDVRGTGGYVIAPPSVHPNGSVYEWDAASKDLTKPAQLTEDLYYLISGSREYGSIPAFELPAYIPQGQRNDTMFRYAASLQAKGLSDAALRAALEAENNHLCSPPLSKSELDLIISSALRYEKGVDKELAEAEAKEILSAENASKAKFLDKNTYRAIFTIKDRFEREIEIQRLREEARDLKCLKAFDSNLSAYKKEYVQVKKQENSNKIQFTDCPLPNLNCKDWICDDFGVRKLNFRGNDEIIEEIACTHPILPTERLVNLDDGTEKVTLAFSKDGGWKKIIVPVSKISDRNKIVTELADLGVAVTSGNSALLVQYLYDVINLNLNVIPQYRSIGRFGWITGDEFSPYASDLKFDGEKSSDKNYFASVKECGDYEQWKAEMAKIRKNPVMKVMLAAACAAPCLKIVEKLPFFVHLWGSSGTGKTVAMLAALSVWGDPSEGKLLRTFNSTFIGMEREAAFAGNIPIGFNELQVMRDRSTLEQVIYMLCEGIGKIRGNVNGGVDKVQQWRTVFFTNGEQPITVFNSGSGAKNRVFEIECTDDLFEDAPHVANFVRANYGHLGKHLIELLQQTEGAARFLTENYNYFYGKLNMVENKQKDSGAMILLGDKLLRMCTGLDDELTITELKAYFTEKRAISIGFRAYEYIKDWIIQNRDRFDGSSFGEVWGRYDGPDSVAIITKVFNDEMDKAGFHPMAVRSELKKLGVLKTYSDKACTIPVRIAGKLIKCVMLELKEI